MDVICAPKAGGPEEFLGCVHGAKLKSASLSSSGT